MRCSCGNDMWDGDGKIVWDVYKVDDIKEYIKQYPEIIEFGDCYANYDNGLKYNVYFWKCDKCGAIHSWTLDDDEIYRIYNLVSDDVDISRDELNRLTEIIPINVNEYGYYDFFPIDELFNKNPIRPYKYFLSNDLLSAFVFNTDTNKVDLKYELSYETNADYSYEIDTFDDLLIYTIEKKNDGHEYSFENGKKILKDTNDYPHKQVNFMIKISKDVYAADPNREPETYTINDLDEFNKKYGKYYSVKKDQ